jgi:hypothetical protein
MQNNNSKLNTILLVILIILAALCLWKITDKDGEDVSDLNEIKIEQTENKNDEEDISEPTPVITGNASDLVSTSIVAGSVVSDSVNWIGILKGAYFFEGSTGVHIMDENKNILRTTHISATTDWMTASPVTFSGTLNFTGLPKGPGFITIESVSGEDNAQVKKQIFIPIIIN